MPDFITTAKGLPGLGTISAQTVEGLAERVVLDITGRHRWPFLLRVQRELTWAANDAVQSFSGIARIWNIMCPDSSGDYYRLTELSDIEFQKYIELNPDITTTDIWRDAGMDGDKYQLELYAAPTSAKTLKVDYTILPNTGSIDTLPARFQRLVVLGMQAMVHPEQPYMIRNYEMGIQEAIAREQDMQGRRWKVGMDNIQAARMRNANNPT